MNPKYPSMQQIRHDALHSTIASVCGTGIEVLLCHGWANGYFHIRHKTMSESPFLYAAMSLLVTHLRIPHFYAIHRVMHPWRVSHSDDLLMSLPLYVEVSLAMLENIHYSFIQTLLHFEI